MKAIRKLYKSQNGYALPSVLMIASLITLLLFSLLTIISFNGFIASKKINKKKLELACVSAINKLLAEQRRPETADRITTEGSTTIRITVKQYGLFYQAKVTAGNSNDSACAVFYLAEKCRKEFTNGLVISDPNLQAAIAGTTLIDGNILSATDNFTRGQISEFPENGDIFHEGARDISDSLKVKLFFPLVDNRLYEPEDESKPITISGTLNLTNAELSNWASAEQIIIEGDLHINGKVIYPELFGLKILVNGNIIIEDNSEFNVPIEFDCKGNIEIGKNCLISACILLSEKDVK
ncbi:MAG: hypothetical protein GXX85_15910, partial [Ignavibacteria bacterium]|nr:hypothetical protein [Ignavibacteria bacterium]